MAQRKCLERYTEIPLQKLPPRESRRLVEELLAIDNLPESVRLMILRKSEGNPFFIEEVIRSLIERGLVYRENERWKAREEVVELEVPDTIQSVILARVDRLEAEAKYVLQCASVIGRLFKHRLLEHLTQKQRELDRYITEFEERELVYEERTVPELEYAFKHALTQEATYQGILEQRRRTFHRQVAEGIERLYRERIEEFYEELAYHYERSGEREKTLEYLVKAGQKAAKQYANEVAIDYYTSTIELAKEMGVSGDRLAEIYEARGLVHGNTMFYEESIDDFSEAAKLYTNRTRRANMFGMMAGTYAWNISDNDEATKYARMDVQEIDAADKSREASSAYGAATIFIDAINLEEGERLLRKSLAISEEMGYKDLLAWQYSLLDWMYGYYRWRPNEFKYWRPDELKEQRRLAREKAYFYLPYLKRNDFPNYAGTCVVLASGVEGDERIYLYREALESGIKCGEGWAVVIAASQLGDAYSDRGEIQKAIEVYEQGWQTGVRVRNIFGGYMLRLTNNLMSLYASRGERSKLLEMMLQMVDSTLVLHHKPKVHPTVQRRWNDTVEETYKMLRAIAPEVYHELERSLESRLEGVDTDGERFFYHGQLMQLALLDGSAKTEFSQSIEAHAREMLKLRPQAGSFAERISRRMEYAIELISAQPEQRQTVAGNLLKQLDRFEDFQEALDVIGLVLPEDVVAQAEVSPSPSLSRQGRGDYIDWNQLERLALGYLQKQRGHDILRSWVEVQRLYERHGYVTQAVSLRYLVEQVQQTMADALREEGITQLLLERVELAEPISPEFIEKFTQASVIFVPSPLMGEGQGEGEGWEWVDPARDCTYRLEETGVEIHVPPNHDIYPRSNYNGPRLLREIDGDFILETCFTDGSEGKKSGGLFVWKDENNYIRLEVPASSSWEGMVYYGANVAGKFIFLACIRLKQRKPGCGLSDKETGLLDT